MHAFYRANFGTLSTCAIFRIPRRHQPEHGHLSVHILKFRHTTTPSGTCRTQLQNKSYFTPENTASQKIIPPALRFTVLSPYDIFRQNHALAHGNTTKTKWSSIAPRFGGTLIICTFPHPARALFICTII